MMKQLLKALTPDPLWRWLRNRRPLRFGSFRRTEPISRGYGMERGTPIDRFYIDRFLAMHASDVHGHVLEFGDDRYTVRFGGQRVTKSSIWHATADNPNATIVADLADANHVESNQFDCIICTQVLMYVYDLRSAMRTIHRVLKPGGSLLLTLPGIAQVTRYDMDRWGDYWRFTELSLQRLLNDTFIGESTSVESHGNVLATMAYLHGLAQEDLKPSELEQNDRDYQFLLTARAVKAVVETLRTRQTESSLETTAR